MCYFFIEFFNVLFDVLSVYFLIYFSIGYIVASFGMFMLSLTCVSKGRLVGCFSCLNGKTCGLG